MRNAALCAVLMAWCAPAMAQTIRVDAAPQHVTDIIRPQQALGAGVDRLPYGAGDKLLKPTSSARS